MIKSILESPRFVFDNSQINDNGILDGRQATGDSRQATATAWPESGSRMDLIGPPR